MSNQPTPPPRGQRFSDPGARVAWNAITALPIEQQHLVLRELQGRLASSFVPASPQETRIARAIGALREAAGILDGSPSIKKFEALRREHPEYGWPPAGTIRTWFGHASWNDCLKRAHLDAVPDGGVIVVPLGASFTSEEVCETLRECAAELGFVPSFSDYVGWARRPDVRERSGRRTTSQATFTRLFGGFSSALIVAGLTNGESGAAAIVRRGVVRAASYFVGDEQIHEALQEIASLLGRSPRVTEYERERARVIEKSLAAGRPRSLPSYAVIQRRHGTWDAALESAGLAALGGRATRTNPRTKRAERAAPQISDIEILACIREAHDELGEPFPVEAYKSWRAQALATARSRGRQRRIASHHTVWKRFGSWEAAYKKALRDHFGDFGASETP